jgi:hypothetical protein
MLTYCYDIVEYRSINKDKPVLYSCFCIILENKFVFLQIDGYFYKCCNYLVLVFFFILHFSFMCMFCRSLFVLCPIYFGHCVVCPLSYLFWSLCCLSFDLRNLITSLVSSNSSYSFHNRSFAHPT